MNSYVKITLGLHHFRLNPSIWFISDVEPKTFPSTATQECVSESGCGGPSAARCLCQDEFLIIAPKYDHLTVWIPRTDLASILFEKEEEEQTAPQKYLYAIYRHGINNINQSEENQLLGVVAATNSAAALSAYYDSSNPTVLHNQCLWTQPLDLLSDTARQEALIKHSRDSQVLDSDHAFCPLCNENPPTKSAPIWTLRP